jgi:RNA polymerase sigma factor (sigma-70 family)
MVSSNGKGIEAARKRAAALLRTPGGDDPPGEAPCPDRCSQDADSLSGRILERFKATRAPELFASFYELNAGWMETHVARAARTLPPGIVPHEMASDVFLDVYRSVDTYDFRGGSAFRRWMCVLARNRIRKALRAFRARPLTLGTEGMDPDDRGAGDPFQRMLGREARARMLRCWWLLIRLCQAGILTTTLPEREFLRLHLAEGLSYRDLAERFDISLPEVASRMRRGRRKVARFMKHCLQRIGKNPPDPAAAGSSGHQARARGWTGLDRALHRDRAGRREATPIQRKPVMKSEKKNAVMR